MMAADQDASQVRVQIRYFAGMSSALGISSEAMELPSVMTDLALLDTLAQRHPAVAGFCRVSRVAVGDRFVRGQCSLREGDEVCIIPPVSGG